MNKRRNQIIAGVIALILIICLIIPLLSAVTAAGL
jgi:hypothetical protein